MNPDLHHKALPKGDTLHWYRIDSILGQGGFGITYLAEDTNLEQRVAIKEYLPNELAVRVDATTVRPISEQHDRMYRWGLDRFLKEAKTLAKFKHPNIVRVQSFFEHNNTAYMVMEYEDGESLGQVIKAGRLRGEQVFLELLDPILDGLAVVHEAGFIHRDIKPDNIFIRTDGTPVLLDFGSARHAISGQTHTLTSLVTPGYAPFEQYHDVEGQQGPWTDIYALGATAYRAITGKTPVEAIKRGMARINHAMDPYLPLADLKAGEFSDQFLEALDCSLRFLEADRPQTARSWQRMLHGAEAVPLEPEIAAPTRPATSDGATLPTQPESAGPVDLDVDRRDTLAPTTPAPQTVPTVPQTQPPVAEAVAASTTGSTAPPARQRTGLWIGAGLVTLVVAGAALWFTQFAQQHKPSVVTATPPPAPVVDPDEQQISEFLQAASAASDSGRLTAPEGNSALDYYRRILHLDPDHREAQDGIAKLLDEHIQAANRAIDALDFDTAMEKTAGAERIDPRAVGVQLVKEKLANAAAAREAEQVRIQREKQEKKQRVAKLLDEAQTLVGAQDYARAIGRYRQVLEIDATNAVAKSGIRTAEAQLQAQSKREAARAGQAQQATAAKTQPAKASPAVQQPYTLAILPWALRGTDNYEQSIFRGLQQALQERADNVRLTHSHYRNFSAGQDSEKLSAGGVGRGELKQVWVKKQGLFSEAELNEPGARAIAKRLGVDAVLLARVSVAAETARIDLYLLEQRGGTAKQTSGQLHFPVWGYHEESAAQVEALILKVIPTRI